MTIVVLWAWFGLLTSSALAYTYGTDDVDNLRLTNGLVLRRIFACALGGALWPIGLGVWLVSLWRETE